MSAAGDPASTVSQASHPDEHSPCASRRTPPTTRAPPRACRRSAQNTLAKLLGSGSLGLGVMTVASGGLGWFMSGRVLRPVRVITETARRASEQHLGERLALTGATGRAQGTGRHVRRHARTPGRGVRHPAPVRRQRLARAAHAADRDAHGDRRDPGQAVPDGAAAHRHGRARAALDRPGREHDRGAAHPGRQRPGQAQHRVHRPGHLGRGRDRRRRSRDRAPEPARRRRA